MKKLVKIILIAFLVLQMVSTNIVGISASEAGDLDSLLRYLELEEERKQNETPVLKATSSLNVTVKGGKTEVVELTLKNVGGYTAKNIIVQAIPETGENIPLAINFLDNNNQISTLNAYHEYKLKLQVIVDAKATARIYPVKLKYTYFNGYKKELDGEDTLYIKVENTEQTAPKLALIDFKLNPATIPENSQGTISCTLQNSGLQDATDIQVVLDGLSSAAISIRNGSSSKIINKLAGGATNPISFDIATAETMNTGNYPVTFKITYKDADKTEHKTEQQYFVNVGGKTDKNKSNLQITNMQVPTATFTVGADFKIRFDILNTGLTDAKNIKITAKPEDTGVVPKSASVQSFQTLEANKSKSVEFTFAATSSSISQNYPIAFIVDFEDGSKTGDTPNVVSFTQYAGVNIKNVEKDLKEEEDAKKNEEQKDETSKNVPKIIINKYQCDPVIVKAGSEFVLSMVYENTHATKTVRNIKVSLATTDTEEKTGASIFTPVNSSNTFYIDTIPPKGMVERSIRLFAIPDAQPKTYSINVNFEYEDNDDFGYTATELVGINVKQPARIDMNDVSLPPEGYLGQPISLYFDFYNTGKVTLSNFTIQIDGELDSDNKKTFYGNIESGMSEFYEATFFPRELGDLAGKIIISYEDPSGEYFEETKDFNIRVIDMPMMEDAMMQGEMMQDESGGGFFGNKLLIIGIGIGIFLLIGGIVTFIVIRRIKKKKGLTFDE